MTIVTKNAHTWITASNQETGEKMEIDVDSTNDMHNLFVTFEINFSDAATPANNTITFYNLSKEHRDFFKKKQKIVFAFNWSESRKVLAEGFISKIDTAASDGTTDTQQITFTEGVNYSNVKARTLKVSKNKKISKYKTVQKTVPGHYVTHRKSVATTEIYKRGPKKGQKHTVNHWHKTREYIPAKKVNHRVKTRATKTILVNKTFPKGTTYKKIIQGVAAQSGMQIDKIELYKNPVTKKAFTATGKPLTLLKQLVEKTESKIVYIRGKLEIINPKAEKRTWYTIDDDDLIQIPAQNESSNDDSKTTWEITTPLIPDITVGSGIIMKSHYLKGKYYVKAGKHFSDGENPQTQCSLVAM